MTDAQFFFFFFFFFNSRKYLVFVDDNAIMKTSKRNILKNRGPYIDPYQPMNYILN